MPSGIIAHSDSDANLNDIHTNDVGALALCLDSCGDSALMVIVALKDAQPRVLGFARVTPAFDSDQVGAFLEALQGLMQQCEADFSAISSAMVVVGPGRFTGMRLGMSMMQGITTPDIPLRGVRRDLVYAGLLEEAGLMLMESGKSVAFVAGAPFVEPPALADAARASQHFAALAAASERPVSLLSLLAPDFAARHYAELLSLVEQGHHRLITPNDAQRATALAQALCTNGESLLELLY